MEQLFAASQENLKNFLSIQESLGNAFAKICDLNTQTVKNNIASFTQATKAIANSQPQDKANVINQSLAPIQQQVIDYNKQLFDLFSQVRQDIQTNVEDIQQDCQKYATAAIENIGKNAPLGTEPLISYLKSAVTASTKVFEGVSKATQQAVNTTTNNLKTQAEQIIQETQKASNSNNTAYAAAHGATDTPNTNTNTTSKNSSKN